MTATKESWTISLVGSLPLAGSADANGSAESSAQVPIANAGARWRSPTKERALTREPWPSKFMLKAVVTMLPTPGARAARP